MSATLSRFLQQLEERVAALEKAQADLAHVFEDAAKVVEAVEALREDFRGMPRYGIRVPRLRELPLGVERALERRGAIEIARLEAGGRPGKDW